MTAWESFWGVAGTSLLALLALFMFIGGGFSLALLVVALIGVAFVFLARGALTMPRRTAACVEPPGIPSAETAPSPASHATVSRRPRIATLTFAGVLVVGVTVAVVHVFLGLYHLTVIALLAVAAGVVTMMAETVPAVARRLRAELSLVGRVPAPGQPVALRVLASKGQCAWGYKESDRWSVDPDGLVSSPFCRAAAVSLAAALGAPAPEPGGECPLACRCPLAGREVTFEARILPAAA